MEGAAANTPASKSRLRQVLGLLLGPGLVYAYVIWLSAHQPAQQSGSLYANPEHWLYATFFYAVIVAGWLALIYWLVCGRRLAELNRKPGKLGTDLLMALGLFVVVYVAGYAFSYVVQQLLPLPSSGAIENIVTGAVLNPLSAVIMLGPYSFLAAGMTEEFTRAFFLDRALALWPGPDATALFVVVAAALFGACHIYQGPIGIVDNSFFGLLLAVFYVRFGRVLPMILAHGLYSAVLMFEYLLWAQAYSGS